VPRVWLFVIHHEGEETADDKEYAYPVFNKVEVTSEMCVRQDTVMCHSYEYSKKVPDGIKAIVVF
jgi:hypothetical protein